MAQTYKTNDFVIVVDDDKVMIRGMGDYGSTGFLGFPCTLMGDFVTLIRRAAGAKKDHG